MINTSIFIIFSLLLLVNVTKQQCVKWGNTFDVSIESNNIKRECKLPDNRDICCSAVSNNSNSNSYYDKGIGDNYYPNKYNKYRNNNNNNNDINRNNKISCTINKEYISSPFELLELSKAIEIDSIPRQDPNEYMTEKRLQSLLDYITSNDYIKNSTIWLDRVKYYMNNNNNNSSSNSNDNDYYFLSRFIITKTCSNNEITKWIEWIEPITLTARHPFGFGNCWRIVGSHYKHNDGKPRVGRSNIDYVLLQSGIGLYDQTHTTNGKRIYSITNTITNNNNNDNNNVRNKRRSNIPKHYMFDAGTSTFDSSLIWFTCGYSQRKVGFDQVYGWEMTLLEPNNYWDKIPLKWKPYWHFHNIPITSGINENNSPLTYIKQLATPNDFIAFKLDIDHPEMEMPIAMTILKDSNVYNLIDEFFFELHFRCEVMTSCGWGKRVPSETHGLILDRSHVLQYFIDLRKNGIRAHIWP